VPVPQTAGSTSQLFRCWNNTLRSIPAPLPATATEFERAVEVQQSEWFEGSPIVTVTYRNGTIVQVNQTSQAVISYVKSPEYFFSPAVITQDPNGDQRITFANGTVHINRASLPSTATLYERAIAQMWFRNYSNGTTETRFVNGT